jgi:hypothetical protein
MKIIDPSQCPREVCRLEIRPVEDDPQFADTFELTIAGEVVAELAALDPDGQIVLDPSQGCAVPRRGSWSLSLVYGDGELTDTHILCRPSNSERSREALTGELQVWATLTVTWAMTQRIQQRG